MFPLLVESLGFLAAALLTFSGIPQLIHTIKTKDVKGLSMGMVWTWFLGCFFMFFYVTLTHANLPLILNYLLNSTVNGILLYYCILYKKH